MRALPNTSATAEETTTVYAYSPARGDFDAATAIRRDRDVYELLQGPVGDGFEAGDLVHCELSDGELIVHSRVFRQRLV